MKTGFASIVALGAGLLASSAQAHVAITYPGWRGNNIITDDEFPFGMQWMYPCGGLGVTRNRTHWPLSGGAIAVQPGFNSGHRSALMYVNIGLGEEPANFTTVVVPMFHLSGPTNDAYDGTFCLPRVPLPEGVRPREGDLASIQVVQAAKHGGALFSCADIIFTGDMSKIPRVNASNCLNSSDLSVEAASVVINDNAIAPPAVSTPPSTSGAIKLVAPISGLLLLTMLFLLSL